MGRSVDYLNHAIGKTFFNVDFTDENGKVTGLDDEDNEIKVEPEDYHHEDNWDDFLIDVVNSLKKAYPSLEQTDGTYKNFEGETRILLTNDFCEIGVAKYYDLASVSIRVNERYFGDPQFNLAEPWIKRVWPNMEKVMNKYIGHEQLNKVGNMSDGCGVYEKV